MTTDTDKLLPCPFCGGKPREYHNQDHQYGYYHYHVIVCDECNAQGPYEPMNGHATEEAAAKAWNTRFLTPQPQIDVDGNSEERKIWDEIFIKSYTPGVIENAQYAEACANEAVVLRRKFLRTAPDSTGEWQPIETAPRDGTQLLGVNAKAYPEIDVIWWERSDGVFTNGSWVNGSLGTQLPYDFEPTHWMPLPSPPVLTTRKGKR